MNTPEYFCWFSALGKPWLLNDNEHTILEVIEQMAGTTTNSELIRLSGVDLKAKAVGIIIARLRARKLIDYDHIETGRMAAGSGRYRVGCLGSYFGKSLLGEMMPEGIRISRLPMLP